MVSILVQMETEDKISYIEYVEYKFYDTTFTTYVLETCVYKSRLCNPLPQVVTAHWPSTQTYQKSNGAF